MAHAASTSLAREKAAPSPRSDLSATAGIMVSLGISAALWVVIGYAVRAAVS